MRVGSYFATSSVSDVATGVGSGARNPNGQSLQYTILVELRRPHARLCSALAPSSPRSKSRTWTSVDLKLAGFYMRTNPFDDYRVVRFQNEPNGYLPVLAKLRHRDE